MRVFLIAGSPAAQAPLDLAPGPGDRVIAVDSGFVHARDWGWQVDLLIGDLDSLPGGRQSVPDGLPTITAPVAKNETDLELALAEALSVGARAVLICGAFGGRPDHMLANVLLLARADLAERDVVIVDGGTSLRLLRGGARLDLAGRPGDLLSLLPLGGPAEGVTTEALRYPLHGETLALGQARGMSNVFLADKVSISLAAGCLLVCHSRQAGHDR